jgi:hypothetical protein
LVNPGLKQQKKERRRQVQFFELKNRTEKRPFVLLHSGELRRLHPVIPFWKERRGKNSRASFSFFTTSPASMSSHSSEESKSSSVGSGQLYYEQLNKIFEVDPDM